mgnify:CR=1 FL=1
MTTPMTTTARGFHDLPIARVQPEAAGSVAVTLAVPPERREGLRHKLAQSLRTGEASDMRTASRNAARWGARSPTALLPAACT